MYLQVDFPVEKTRGTDIPNFRRFVVIFKIDLIGVPIWPLD